MINKIGIFQKKSGFILVGRNIFLLLYGIIVNN